MSEEKKSSKDKKPKQKAQAKPEPVDHEKPGLPDVDLRKVMGCGG